MSRWYSVRDLATVRQLRETWGNILARLRANTSPFPTLCDALACAAGMQLIREHHRGYGELLTLLEQQAPASKQRFWGPEFPETPTSPMARAAIAAVVEFERVAAGCRGGTPAVEAHGCAALAPATPALAVGPAPEAYQVALHNLPANPLLLASKMQELPCPDNRVNNQTSGGKDNVRAL